MFDKFHAVKHLHDAVDRVRRGVHRIPKRVGDERLTGSKYLGLRRPEDLSETQRAVFRALQREDLKVGRAWALKERFRAVSQWVKKTARGSRNAEHFKTAIYFHCDGLDLYPHEGR